MASIFFCLLILRKTELTPLPLLNVIIFPARKINLMFVPHIILLYWFILALFLNGKYVFLFFGSAKNRTDTLTLYYALCSGSVAAILCINDQFVSLIYEEWYIDGQASFHHSRL